MALDSQSADVTGLSVCVLTQGRDHAVSAWVGLAGEAGALDRTSSSSNSGAAGSRPRLKKTGGHLRTNRSGGHLLSKLTCHERRLVLQWHA